MQLLEYIRNSRIQNFNVERRTQLIEPNNQNRIQSKLKKK